MELESLNNGAIWWNPQKDTKNMLQQISLQGQTNPFRIMEDEIMLPKDPTNFYLTFQVFESPYPSLLSFVAIIYLYMTSFVWLFFSGFVQPQFNLPALMIESRHKN